jgi:AcrR family transcriptional regulator
VAELVQDSEWSTDRDVGLRELGKAERQRRLKESAKAEFRERGYDEVTTRQIARRAGVSIGTLFVYARDKRDLLFLVFNDELDPVAERAWASLPRNKLTVDTLCALARPWYRYFEENAVLGRYAFREMTFYEPHSHDFGKQCDRYRARMRCIEQWMTEIVGGGCQSGELSFDEPVAVVGNLFYKIYLAEIREWIHQAAPDAGQGIRSLRRKFCILVDGLQRPSVR